MVLGGYGIDELTVEERFWRDTQPFLLAQGYQLRPRFRPGWILSWKSSESTGFNPLSREDSYFNEHSETIDATRVKDGESVFIKRVPKHSLELDIIRYLSTHQMRQDRRNHTVPLLDFLVGEQDFDFIVMPVLRRFNDPRFVYVEEVVDFVRQTLEGLSFLHGASVAHRDCSDLNIMFDASHMYLNGFHPSIQSRALNDNHLASHVNRADSTPSPTYYFTDYGISSHFEDPEKPRLVTGRRCSDKSVPELSEVVPYDPFRTDVYILGNVYKRTFTDVYSNLSFLIPLVVEMTRTDPRSRPTADEALSLFNRILAQQTSLSLRWLLLESDLTQSERNRRGFLSVLHLFQQSFRCFLKSPLKIILLAVTTTTIIYGPRNVYVRIRDVFQRHSPR